MASDSAVAALIAVATSRLDAAEDEIRALRLQVAALEKEASERRGRDLVSARVIPWLALVISAGSATRIWGWW